MPSMPEQDSAVAAAWNSYDGKARVRLRSIWSDTRGKGTLRLVANKSLEIRTALDELEGTREFHDLVEILRASVTASGYHKGNSSFWELAIRNALRISGYYKGLAIRRRIDSKAVLDSLVKAFAPHDVTITYLAPLEYVWLEAPRIDLQNVSIVKFNTNELNKILKTEVCKLFYPLAVVNTEFLSMYWFLVVTEKRRLRPLGKIDVDLGSIGKVTPQYSPYPSLERALYRLAMYDWVPDWARDEPEKKEKSKKAKKKGDEWKGWLGFKVPFVIRVTDNIFDGPRRTPNMEILETEPCFDPYTQEEIGEQPSRYLNLDNEETQALKRCLLRVDIMLRKIDPFLEAWPFLRRALGFMIKGFFAKGLEQLLWHITVLECLFGERQPGVTAVLAQRVALVLGETEAERKEIKKLFRGLYEIRSALVHGDEIKDVVWEGHLKIARDLARRSLLWFLSFAEEISKRTKGSSSSTLPERKELLALIDSRAETIIQLAKVLKSIPNSFPAVKAWQQPWSARP